MRSELGSIRQKGKGRWEVRVSLGHDRVTGKRKTKSKTVRGTKKDARLALNALLSQYGMSADGSMTLADFIRSVYVPWHDERYPRRDTREKLKYAMEKLCEDLGGYELAELTRPVLVAWCGRSAAWRRNKLRAVLNKAVEWEYIPRNPMPKCEAQDTTPDRKRITVEQVLEILDAVHGTAIEPGVILQAYCGLRPAEALAVDWADIDFEKCTVDVCRTWHYVKGEGWMQDTKNVNSRGRVHVPEAALARLKEIRTQGGTIRKGALMPTANGTGRMIPNTYRKIWERIARPILGDDYIPPKNLRQTHGSILFDEGVSIEFIKERLRHSSTRITERYYVRPDSTADETSSDTIESVLGAS